MVPLPPSGPSHFFRHSLHYPPPSPLFADRAYHVSCLPCHWDPEHPPLGDLDGDGVPLAPRLSAQRLRTMNATTPARGCPVCTAAVACQGRLPNNFTGGHNGMCGQGTW